MFLQLTNSLQEEKRFFSSFCVKYALPDSVFVFVFFFSKIVLRNSLVVSEICLHLKFKCYILCKYVTFKMQLIRLLLTLYDKKKAPSYCELSFDIVLKMTTNLFYISYNTVVVSTQAFSHMYHMCNFQ